MYTLLYVCVALWWAVAIVHETNDQYKMCDYKEWYMSVYIILCIMQVCANFYRRVRSRQRELNLVYGSIRNDTSWKEKMYSAISFILLCTSNIYLWVAVGFIISWSPLHCFCFGQNYAMLSAMFGASFYSSYRGEKWARRTASHIVYQSVPTEECNRMIP